jgi:hypothetical protein
MGSLNVVAPSIVISPIAICADGSAHRVKDAALAQQRKFVISVWDQPPFGLTPQNADHRAEIIK